MSKVYWSVGLPPLARYWEIDMLMMVARHTGAGFVRLRQPFPVRVNRFRAEIIRQFMELTSAPKDRLVLLDVDHDQPPQVVNLLANPHIDLPVHMALTFKRSREMPLALAMNYSDGWDKPPQHVTGWKKAGDILECDRGGTAAFCVQRWVFERLFEEYGIGPAGLFEYVDQDDCDKHFAQLCSGVDIKHYVNTGIVSPHLADGPIWVGLEEFDAWAKANGQPGAPSTFVPTRVGTTQ